MLKKTAKFLAMVGIITIFVTSADMIAAASENTDVAAAEETTISGEEQEEADPSIDSPEAENNVQADDDQIADLLNDEDSSATDFSEEDSDMENEAGLIDTREENNEEEIVDVIPDSPEIDQDLNNDADLDTQEEIKTTTVQELQGEGTALSDGWHTLDQGKVYVRYGEVLTGFQTVLGKDYYFDKNGIMQTGFFEAEYWFSYADDSYKETGPCYAGSDGVLLTGFHNIGGNRYYFYPETINYIWEGHCHKHMIATGHFGADGFYYYGDPENNGALFAGELDIYYYREKEEDGFPKFSQKTCYWVYENGRKEYYVNENGVLARGVFEVDGVKYKTRIFQQKLLRGWESYEEVTYYAYEDGTLATGLTCIDGRYYYFDPESCMRTDRSIIYIDGERYRIRSDGTLYEGFYGNTYSWPATETEHTPYSVATGLFEVNGKTYGAYIDGSIHSGMLDEEFKEESGFWYYDSTGSHYKPDHDFGTFTYYSKLTNTENEIPTLVKGWFDVGSSTFYAGSDFKVKRGFQWIDGKRYYFKDSNLDPCLTTGWFALNGFKYYADKTGVLQENFQTINEKKYYFWPDTKDGHYHYTMAKNWFKVNGFSYYAGSDGVLRKGFQTIGGKKYYFWPDTKEGHYRYTMAKGWFSLNGFKYWADSSGVVATGFKTINGKGYYFWPDSKDGHYRHTMVKGWFSANGFKYWADSDGVVVTGFKTINGKGYYFWPKTANGHYAKTMAKGWFSSNGFKYWADKNGVLATGWKTINGKKYYFWPKTANGHYAKTMATGTVTIDNKKYTFAKDGALKK